jgi:uncharacterized protein
VAHPRRPGGAPDGGESALKAEHHAQLRLLDVQDLDTTLDKLSQRRRTLPEIARVDDLEHRRTTIADGLGLMRADVDDLQREQRKADADVEQVRARRTRNQERLDKGQVGSPRELESLQHELETLDRRISDLEDAEIEVMERLETAETELGDMEANRQALDGEIVTARASRDEVLSGLDADLEQTRSARDKLAADVPPDLLALYERLRANHNGVGAAELSHGRCGGCRLELNQADLRSIAAAAEDDVVRCEECGRILVRTSASGI